MKIIKNILNTIFFLTAFFVITISFFAVHNKTKYGMPYTFGLASSQVISGSMEPEIMTDDYILIKKVHPNDELKENNIYIYDDGERKILHRLIKIMDDGTLIFKGDANEGIDKPVLRNQVIGEYVKTYDNFIITPYEILSITCSTIEIICLAGIFVIEYYKKKNNKRPIGQVSKNLE